MKKPKPPQKQEKLPDGAGGSGDILGDALDFLGKALLGEIFDAPEEVTESESESTDATESPGGEPKPEPKRSKRTFEHIFRLEGPASAGTGIASPAETKGEAKGGADKEKK